MSTTTDDRPAISERRIQRLREAVRGGVLTAADPGYADRRWFDATTPRRPAVIVQVAGTADVTAAVTFARRHELTVSVRAGQGQTGPTRSGDVIIDLAALRGVVVDRAARTATIRGGEIGRGLDAATFAHGLAVPTGRSPLAGVAGAVLRGAAGWLSPQRGLTCDNLVSADVITADGRAVLASADHEPDLYWALRGGGPVGVVTSLTLRLHPVERVLAGVLLFRPDDAADVLAALDALHAHDRDEFAGAAALVTAPPAACVPGNVVGHPVLAVIPVWLGDPAEGAAFMSGLRAVRPLADATGPMPYPDLAAMADDWPASETRRAFASKTVPALLPAAALLEDLAANLRETGGCLTFARLGGAISRIAPIATAATDRDAAWQAHLGAQWSVAGEDTERSAWVAGTAERLSAEPVSQRSSTHGERLRAIHRAWDPAGMFGRPDKSPSTSIETSRA